MLVVSQQLRCHPFDINVFLKYDAERWMIMRHNGLSIVMVDHPIYVKETNKLQYMQL